MALSLIGLIGLSLLGLVFTSPVGALVYAVLITLWVLAWWSHLAGYVEIRDEILIRRCWRRRTVRRGDIWRIDLLGKEAPIAVLHDRSRFDLSPVCRPIQLLGTNWGLAEAQRAEAVLTAWVRGEDLDVR